MRILMTLLLTLASGLFPLLAVTQDRAWAARLTGLIAIILAISFVYYLGVKWTRKSGSTEQKKTSQTLTGAQLFFRRIWSNAFLAVIVVIFLGESILVARALGERNQISWIEPLHRTQDQLAIWLSPIVPVLQKLPQALVKEGFQGRESIVTGAYAVGYLTSFICLGIFFQVFVRTLINPNYPSADFLKANPITPGQIFSALASPVIVFIMIYGALTKHDVSRLRILRPSSRYAKQEWLWNFETNDVELIYSAIFGRLFFLFSCMLILCFVLMLIKHKIRSPKDPPHHAHDRRFESQ